MRVWFGSNHSLGDRLPGRLEIDIAREDGTAGQTLYDQIFFTVPPGFHVHNDLVAAALLTLTGRAYPVVTFNFPISRRCADILTAHYKLEQVGPVEPELEPRQRGRLLGLSFSGGVDSASALVLLESIGADVRVITSDYGGRFARERAGYEQFHRDVTCRTDLRDKGLDRGGRFNFAAALLHADYLDLYGLATGHNFHHHPPTSIERLDRGQEPLFRSYDLPFTAGGLDEVHLIRCLTMVGSLKILLALAPDRLEGIMTASGSRQTSRYFSRAMIVRWFCRRAGQPVPAFLEAVEIPTRAPRFGAGLTDFNAMFVAKHYGARAGNYVARGIARQDLAFLDDLTLSFYEKYNTNLIPLIPSEIRHDVLQALHRCGIEPYDERDWRELGSVRDFLTRIRASDPDTSTGARAALERVPHT